MSTFETFPCSVIVRKDADPYVGKGRHDAVAKQAKKVKGEAVKAICLPLEVYAQAEADAENSTNHQATLYRLLANLKQGSFELETPTKE